MNASTHRSCIAWRAVAGILLCGAVSLLAATLVSAAQHGTETDKGGASRYTPTKGEWLCLFLNTRQALMNSERASRGVDVHYLYDLSRPDVVRIQLLFPQGTGEEQLHICAARAEQHAVEVAKVYGWQSWLKVEREERTVSYRSHPDALIR